MTGIERGSVVREVIGEWLLLNDSYTEFPLPSGYWKDADRLVKWLADRGYTIASTDSIGKDDE